MLCTASFRGLPVSDLMIGLAFPTSQGSLMWHPAMSNECVFSGGIPNQIPHMLRRLRGMKVSFMFHAVDCYVIRS